MRKPYACVIGPLAFFILLLGLMVAFRFHSSGQYPPSSNELSNADLAYLETCFHLHGLDQSRKVRCVIQYGDQFAEATEISMRVDAPPGVMQHIAGGIWQSKIPPAASERRFETELKLPDEIMPKWWDVLPLKAGDKTGDEASRGGTYVLRQQKDGTMTLYSVCGIEPKDVGPALTAIINRLEPRTTEFISQGGGMYEAFWEPSSATKRTEAK